MESGLESKKNKNGFFLKTKKEKKALHKKSSFIGQLKKNKILLFQIKHF